ncbi:hypothetical protein ATANTOWER_016898 [Ataeniobius toweri]|uniref:Uncharacterized protein n=1 Tax=Ataeniobius toweri TaxID=208326 RepID=A0ABU7APL8_9TELE|nr:hypothetical protein [Ataeniobius toweri]
MCTDGPEAAELQPQRGGKTFFYYVVIFGSVGPAAVFCAVCCSVVKKRRRKRKMKIRSFRTYILQKLQSVRRYISSE